MQDTLDALTQIIARRLFRVTNHARDELATIQALLGPTAYVEHAWKERYPATAPRASQDWPFRRAASGNVRQLKTRQR